MHWLTEMTKYLEPIYYLTSIGLFASVIIGLYQLKLLKADIKTKNQRAATEKSLEYMDWFASEFFPSLNKFREKHNEIRDALINKASGEEKQRLISEFKKPLKVDVDPKDKFSKTDTEIIYYSIPMSCMKVARVDNILNQLEFFSAAMLSGLADEKLTFNPLSDAYCDIVEEFYFVICELRGENGKLYSHVVKLYEVWKTRINKQKLEGQHREISEKMSKIPDTKITPLGL
jgi:hypothetical protein